MWRAATESLCGLRVQGDRLCLDPRLPSTWHALSALGQASLHLVVTGPKGPPSVDKA